MGKAATILVLGDPGPFRKELLIHKELDVVWASDVDDAKAILTTTTIDACIVSSSLRDDVDSLKSILLNVPCISLQPPDTARVRPDYESIVEVEKVDSLVSLLSEHTGIRFARYPRADVSTQVSVRYAGSVHVLESIDLSLSGIGIAGFPPAQVGTRVDLVVDLAERTLHLPARIVRWFEHDGRRAAGLVFVELSESQRTAIHDAVTRVLQWAPEQRLSAEALFGDLALDDVTPAALETQDVSGAAVPAFVLRTQDLEIPVLCRVLDGDTEGAPGWILKVANQLTAIEASAVRGKASPAWVHRVLRLRLHFAQSERMPKGRKLPSALLDEAYRTFESLKEEMENQSATIVAQIAKIRAELLRDMVSARKRPLPVPRLTPASSDDLLPAFR